MALQKMLQAAQQWAGVHISCELMGLSDRVRNLVFTNLDFSQQMCAAFIEYTIAIRASENGYARNHENLEIALRILQRSHPGTFRINDEGKIDFNDDVEN
ncbi:unnamed protein product [Caenorhabditis nigoni]